MSVPGPSSAGFASVGSAARYGSASGVSSNASNGRVAGAASAALAPPPIPPRPEMGAAQAVRLPDSRYFPREGWERYDTAQFKANFIEYIGVENAKERDMENRRREPLRPHEHWESGNPMIDSMGRQIEDMDADRVARKVIPAAIVEGRPLYAGERNVREVVYLAVRKRFPGYPEEVAVAAADRWFGRFIAITRLVLNAQAREPVLGAAGPVALAEVQFPDSRNFPGEDQWALYNTPQFKADFIEHIGVKHEADREMVRRRREPIPRHEHVEREHNPFNGAYENFMDGLQQQIEDGDADSVAIEVIPKAIVEGCDLYRGRGNMREVIYRAVRAKYPRYPEGIAIAAANRWFDRFAFMVRGVLDQQARERARVEAEAAARAAREAEDQKCCGFWSWWRRHR